MERPGRKSAANLSVVAPSGVLAVHRLTPPAELCAAESLVWSRVVNAMPADWWDASNAVLLVEYCRAWVMCDRLAGMLSAADDVAEVKTLLKMRNTESCRLTTLATKMRLSQQSKYSEKGAEGKHRRGTSAKPWLPAE